MFGLHTVARKRDTIWKGLSTETQRDNPTPTDV